MSNPTTKGNRATARGTCRCRERHRKFLRTGKSSHGEFLGWAVRGEMPRGRVVTTEAAELAVGTVKPRAHGSDPRPHDASDVPVSEAVDISEIHDRAKVFAERLECQLVMPVVTAGASPAS